MPAITDTDHGVVAQAIEAATDEQLAKQIRPNNSTDGSNAVELTSAIVHDVLTGLQNRWLKSPDPKKPPGSQEEWRRVYSPDPTRPKMKLTRPQMRLILQGNKTERQMRRRPVSAAINASITGLEVRFSARRTGGAPVQAYAWDFGDGTSSSEPTPTHTYLKANDYDVTLDVSDTKYASGQATKKVTVG